MKTIKIESFDPEVLDKALDLIAEEAKAARDAFILGEEEAGCTHFDNALDAFWLASKQLSFKIKDAKPKKAKKR